jgi:hypothetical protein
MVIFKNLKLKYILIFYISIMNQSTGLSLRSIDNVGLLSKDTCKFKYYQVVRSMGESGYDCNLFYSQKSRSILIDNNKFNCQYNDDGDPTDGFHFDLKFNPYNLESNLMKFVKYKNGNIDDSIYFFYKGKLLGLGLYKIGYLQEGLGLDLKSGTTVYFILKENNRIRERYEFEDDVLQTHTYFYTNYTVINTYLFDEKYKYQGIIDSLSRRQGYFYFTLGANRLDYYENDLLQNEIKYFILNQAGNIDSTNFISVIYKDGKKEGYTYCQINGKIISEGEYRNDAAYSGTIAEYFGPGYTVSSYKDGKQLSVLNYDNAFNEKSSKIQEVLEKPLDNKIVLVQQSDGSTRISDSENNIFYTIRDSSVMDFFIAGLYFNRINHDSMLTAIVSQPFNIIAKMEYRITDNAGSVVFYKENIELCSSVYKDGKITSGKIIIEPLFTNSQLVNHYIEYDFDSNKAIFYYPFLNLKLVYAVSNPLGSLVNSVYESLVYKKLNQIVAIDSNAVYYQFNQNLLFNYNIVIDDQESYISKYVTETGEETEKIFLSVDNIKNILESIFKK